MTLAERLRQAESLTPGEIAGRWAQCQESYLALTARRRFAFEAGLDQRVEQLHGLEDRAKALRAFWDKRMEEAQIEFPDVDEDAIERQVVTDDYLALIHQRKLSVADHEAAILVKDEALAVQIAGEIKQLTRLIEVLRPAFETLVQEETESQ